MSPLQQTVSGASFYSMPLSGKERGRVPLLSHRHLGHGHWCLPSSALSSGPGWAGLESTWACLLVAVTEEWHRQRGLQPWGPPQWCLHAAGPTGQCAMPLGHPRKG